MNYLNPLIGGIVIGLASTLLLHTLGRIAGISGILSSLLTRPSKANIWQIFFIIGLIVGGLTLKGYDFPGLSYTFRPSIYELVLGGLLVGFGTRLGSGCTSGHGVCGIARLSKRSITATIIFIIFGILTVLVRRSLL